MKENGGMISDFDFEENLVLLWGEVLSTWDALIGLFLGPPKWSLETRLVAFLASIF